jgi:hypothetical protein
MANIYVEGKGPQGNQDSESLQLSAVPGSEPSRGLAVVYGADAYHATIAGAAAAAIGILEEDAVVVVRGGVSVVGQANKVVERGQVVAQIGANVTAGQSLATNAAGQLVPAVATNPIVAVALESQVYVAPGSFACVYVLGFFGTVIHP